MTGAGDGIADTTDGPQPTTHVATVDGQRSFCSRCCRSPPALELTVSETLLSFGLATGDVTSGRLQGYG
jgi:hypothetical protein